MLVSLAVLRSGCCRLGTYHARRCPRGQSASWLMIKTSVAAVAPNALLPGDLAVWDGHVAMVVGSGMMIEARYQ